MTRSTLAFQQCDVLLRDKHGAVPEVDLQQGFHNAYADLRSQAQ